MTLIIDKNVIYQIAIGNKDVADALLKRLASGEKVYIATVAHRELTVLSPGDKAAGYKKLLDDMHITTPPPTNWGDRADFHVRNVQAGKVPKGESLNFENNVKQYAKKLDPITGLPRGTDAFVAAEADALKAELMTYDKSFAHQSEKLGIKIAPESRLPTKEGNAALENISTARKLLKADSVKMLAKRFFRFDMGAFQAGAKASLRAIFSLDNILFEIALKILEIADKAAAEKAIVSIQVRFLKEGFAKGVAGGCLGWSDERVVSNLFNKMTPYRVQDMMDPGGLLPRSLILKLAEASENMGVLAGYNYARGRSPQWREGLRIFAASMLERQGWRFTSSTDPYYFVDKYAWVLRFQTNPIAEGLMRFESVKPDAAPLHFRNQRERAWPGTRG